jgi:hypothetical protein
MPRVEWIGLLLPSGDPLISFDKLTRKLSKKQLEALDTMDEAMVNMFRIQTGGGTNFQLGPESGLSKSYLWCVANNHIEVVTDSDYRIIQRMGERMQFRNLDDPREANREPTYPDANYIAGFMAVGPRGELLRPNKLPASIVSRMLRVAKHRYKLGEEAKVIGERIGRWGPPPQ